MAALLMGALAHLHCRRGVSKYRGWSVLISLLGSMAFALALVFRWLQRDQPSSERG